MNTELPIAAHRDEILAALAAHSVVVVCGETGSGKTTQLPQYFLDAGRGTKGLVAVTQPRRLAAITVAERVDEELGRENHLVGWQHRFHRHTAPSNRIKFMTDGILLSELRHDPLLKAYDTILVDEAHERSLNIDFLLGCLKRILARRKDLKVVVSSATLDAELFSKFFDGAPVLKIPGRTFPVEVRWRPPESDDPDLPACVADAVDECLDDRPEGDVLVFLPGERDIRECAKRIEGRERKHVVVIPLLAALSAGEQKRAFTLLPGERRVVLATNVAETSVTIPGIRYVVDSGLARISRWSPRAHMKRLHIEGISRASAEQRKGRCGRIGPGVCIRLYDEDDFEKRAEYTDPDIRRTSLSGTILTMLENRLGDIEEFPFLQPPPGGAISEGRKELAVLDAIERNEERGTWHLTSLGRRLARLPIEPALARMLFEADHNAAMRDTLIVVAALACEDPLVRPAEKQEQAAQAHAKFRDKTSDFLGILKLWETLHPSPALSRGATRRLCQDLFVSYRKFCEWEDVHEQLRDMMKREGCDVTTTQGGPIGMHKALLSGLLRNVGVYDPEERNYKGAGGGRFYLFPGSGVARAKTPPEWVMAGELVDTSRLFARRVATIDPRWIEPLAYNVIRYSYHGETWDAASGTARAMRKSVLWGLTIRDNVRCDISRTNPALAREIFILEGLVRGAFPKPIPAVVQGNLKTIAERTEVSRKARETTLDEELDAFAARYEERLPHECVNVPSFREWLKHASKRDIDALRFHDDEFDGPALHPEGYPDKIILAGHSLRLDYVHDPESEEDGITLSVPVSALDAVVRLLEPSRLVPGALVGKAAFALRLLQRSALSALAASVGKSTRALDETVLAKEVIAKISDEGAFLPSFIETLAREYGVPMPYCTWDEEEFPAAHRLRFRVHPEKHRGTTALATRDIEDVAALARDLREQHPDVMPSPWLAGEKPVERFSDAVIQPTVVEIGTMGPKKLYAWKALATDGVRLFKTEKEARASHADAFTKLCLKTFREEPPKKASELHCDAIWRAAMETWGVQPCEEGEAKKRVGKFRALRDAIRALAEQLADMKADIERALQDERVPDGVLLDVSEQLAWLMGAGYIRRTPVARLAQYPRYLQAIEKRIEDACASPSKDEKRAAPVRAAWKRHLDLLANRDAYGPVDEAALKEHAEMLEEVRVSTFAQTLGTPYPASTVRLDKIWSRVFVG